MSPKHRVFLSNPSSFTLNHWYKNEPSSIVRSIFDTRCMRSARDARNSVALTVVVFRHATSRH